MDGLLKMLVAMACLVIIAGGGFFFYSQYSDYQKLADAKTEVETAKIRMRTAELASAGCRPEVDQLLAQHKASPITSVFEIPSELKADLDICIEQRIMFPFEQSELKASGLDKLLQK